MQIFLNDIDEATRFVNDLSNCPYEVDLESGVISIDAKSLLGVITMGINRKLNVVCAADHMPAVKKLIRDYCIA